MNRALEPSRLILVVGFVCLGLTAIPAQARGRGGLIGQGRGPAVSGPSYVTPYYFPSFGGVGPYGFYGGYYSPFFNFVPTGTTDPYLPKYWWAERYPTASPRQAGYNPNSGYPPEEVTTLLLVTSPIKARVILDGLFVGTSDSLGPIQLPVGVHTVRVEAVGFEPSHTVINVEEPTVQQLEVRLTPVERAEVEPQK